MQEISEITRRTTTDIVFEKLQDEITSLELLPGTKLSEAEVAKRFGVSRQPVRDAFNRLDNLELVLIRPQKATEVRGFSMQRIAHARFVRLAVEAEVIKRAAAVWDAERARKLEQNLCFQAQAVETSKTDQFHKLDYDFHRLICELSGYPLAFETIQECKQKIDRLCVLSFGRKNEPRTLLKDHQKLATALGNRSAEEADSVIRLHLSRLDDTIAEIHKSHSEYFE